MHPETPQRPVAEGGRERLNAYNANATGRRLRNTSERSGRALSSENVECRRTCIQVQMEFRAEKPKSTRFQRRMLQEKKLLRYHQSLTVLDLGARVKSVQKLDPVVV
ncbi:hypothetical protein EVAR_17846_1 [Eumeta japonica]|uniref:Uncharacterized protein n=1 Tax=Eumeta variegata TaxID=151549 RepID=A0A4C1TU95_EUMVA|nr:hypothetical protein EVAR_17846_1 [Eumeta japonica]